ncbi:hypothetical protein ANTQUA_LOCUS7819 [Anthophora quadrimaculata]
MGNRERRVNVLWLGIEKEFLSQFVVSSRRRIYRRSRKEIFKKLTYSSDTESSKSISDGSFWRIRQTEGPGKRISREGAGVQGREKEREREVSLWCNHC